MKEKTIKSIVNTKEVGRVISYFSGIAKIKGLPHVFVHEVLLSEDGQPVALVIGFDEEYVDALIFNTEFDINSLIFRSREIFSIPWSKDYLGRVINGLGQPLDGFSLIKGKGRAVFNEAPPIIKRDTVKRPLTTGLKVIDTTLPLGRGQRELIIGDRKLGKSTLALDAILNQKNAQPQVYCIYVLCSQEQSAIEEVVAALKTYDATLHTAVVATTADDSYAAQYLAPFVGCTIGEYFRDHGLDALIIYDDLSKHAQTYRSINLLMQRPPGREAYPGDIFSLHAGLLERAAQVSKKEGGGSLTALSIVETQEGDITSFIPTNIISITDGQIYLERSLYQEGFLPAVNIGLSVSRVGSEAQQELLREVTGNLRLILAQHKELQKLIQLETNISETAQKKIQRGELLLELLKQPKHTKVTWQEQVVLFYAVANGFFDDLDKSQWAQFEKLLLELLRTKYIRILESFAPDKSDPDLAKQIANIVTDFKQEFAG